MTLSVVVARTNSDGIEYLEEGARAVWTRLSERAQHFTTVREATRVAMRLPSRLRAYALPIH
jgi:hypothetical protein